MIKKFLNKKLFNDFVFLCDFEGDRNLFFYKLNSLGFVSISFSIVYLEDFLYKYRLICYSPIGIFRKVFDCAQDCAEYINCFYDNHKNEC